MSQTYSSADNTIPDDISSYSGSDIEFDNCLNENEIENESESTFNDFCDEPQLLPDDNKPLYDDSLINVYQILFSIFVARFGLNGNRSEALLALFSKLLPHPNRIKLNMMQESFMDLSKGYLKEILCHHCSKRRVNRKHCLNEKCKFYQKTSGIQEQEIFFFDNKKQMENILEREKTTLDFNVAVYFLQLFSILINSKT